MKSHPVIVLSNSDIIKEEEYFVGVMMTTERKDDLYSFEITSSMLSKDLNVPYSEVRLHLISAFRTREVVTTSNFSSRIKPEFFREIIKQINQITFAQH